jgi:hypothetical protein
MLSISSPTLAAQLDKYALSLADLVAEKNAALKDSLS